MLTKRIQYDMYLPDTQHPYKIEQTRPLGSVREYILFANQAVYYSSPAVIIGHLTHCEIMFQL